jgi:hypothetical protein
MVVEGDLDSHGWVALLQPSPSQVERDAFDAAPGDDNDELVAADLCVVDQEVVTGVRRIELPDD